MGRRQSQELDGYKVSVERFVKEYARAVKNTRRSKAIYAGFLERVDWCLAVLRREERELAVASRRRPSSGTAARGNGASSGHRNGSSVRREAAEA